RSQVQQSQLARDVARREDLYRDFIIAASRAYADAFLNSEPQIPDLVALYGMVSRMRILCSPEVVALANQIMELTVDTYFQPNKTIRELHEMVRKNGSWIDPLKEFSELAREELRSLAPHRGHGAF